MPTTAAGLQTLIRSLDSKSGVRLARRCRPSRRRSCSAIRTGLSSEAAIGRAHAFYENVIDGARQAGVSSLDPIHAPLDFGFGWGRISRVFMERVRLAKHPWPGRRSFVRRPTARVDRLHNFRVCSPIRRPFPDASFDVIYLYSVFSHLSEAACQAWMQLSSQRILKPGGIVAFTTRHDSFFAILEWAKKQGTIASAYIHALGKLFPDLDVARETTKPVAIVHASSRALAAVARETRASTEKPGFRKPTRAPGLVTVGDSWPDTSTAPSMTRRVSSLKRAI